MQSTTNLLRQVHPKFFKEGEVLSIAFRPFPKDDGLLSVYDGDMIQPQPAWQHYTARGYESAGVWAVTNNEVTDCGLTARADVEGQFPEHAVIDFSELEEKQQRAKSKILAEKANERGCLFSS
jgi:hypothetical protein